MKQMEGLARFNEPAPSNQMANIRNSLSDWEAAAAAAVAVVVVGLKGYDEGPKLSEGVR